MSIPDELLTEIEAGEAILQQKEVAAMTKEQEALRAQRRFVQTQLSLICQALPEKLRPFVYVQLDKYHIESGVIPNGHIQIVDLDIPGLAPMRVTMEYRGGSEDWLVYGMTRVISSTTKEVIGGYAICGIVGHEYDWLSNNRMLHTNDWQEALALAKRQQERMVEIIKIDGEETRKPLPRTAGELSLN